MYNSDINFIKISEVQRKKTKTGFYGLYKRNHCSTCYAVYIPGVGEFTDPAATLQKFYNGAVIAKHGNYYRLIQPDKFKKTYLHTGGLEFKKYANSRYQRWQKLQSNAVIPYKKYCKKQLTLEKKEHNRRLASFRMRVENKIREIKIFKDYVTYLPQFSEEIQLEL